MSKKLVSPSRLQRKLASLYGDNDALAIQFKNEIDACEAFPTHSRGRSFSRPLPSAVRTTNHRRALLCSYVK